MAQAGYTPISLYYSTTAAAVPIAGNLVPGELAININDGRLYFENSSGVVTLLAQSSSASPVTTISFGSTGLTPSTATSGAVTVAGTLAIANGGTGNTSGAAVTFTSTNQNSQFNSVGVGTAGSGTTGEIRATNNITAFYSSDRKLKENIQDVPNALAIVTAIGSKTFDWTDDHIAKHGGEDGYFVQKSDFGVIAQDVQSVFPQAVRTREDGTLAVDYEKLSTLAFGAISELLKRIEVLENK